MSIPKVTENLFLLQLSNYLSHTESSNLEVKSEIK